MIPNQMTAISIEGGKGPAESLKPVSVEVPRPGPGQMLIRVVAAGVNRPDVVQRLGFYPPPPGAPSTLGLEVAGEVVALGDGTGRWREGDMVTALLPGGGYAQYAVADGRHALPVPRGLDMIRAAALPETVFTVFSNVFEIGGLMAGQTLLVHGANSGIALTATAMAKAAGAKVIVTARGPAKLDAARALGADLLIDASAEDFAPAVKAAGGADVVLEMVGGDYIARDIACMNRGGRMVVIATQAAAKAEADFMAVMVKRLVVTGSTLRPRDADEKARLAAAVEKTVWPWIEAGQVRPVIDAVYPLEQAALAHAHMEADHAGKIVLTN